MQTHKLFIILMSLLSIIVTLPIVAMDKPNPKKSNEELSEAIRSADLTRVKAALAAGANPNGVHGVRSMIEEAVSADLYCSGDPTSDEVAIVETLVDAGVNVNQPDRRNNYPLDYAMTGQCPAVMVATLLRLGANANIAGRSGFTPLHAAARHNLNEVILLLLAAGADPARQYVNQTPLAIAREEGHEAASQILQNPRQLLQAAIRNGFQHAIRFIANDRNINQADESGITPLGHAIQSRQPEVVRLLITELGANPQQAFGRPQRTPLQEAQNLGLQEIVAILQQGTQSGPVPVAQQPAPLMSPAAAAQQLGRQQPAGKGWVAWLWGSAK